MIDIYSERAHLIRLLFEHYHAYLATDEEAEEGFRTVACIHLDTGEQCCWHLSDEDAKLFTGIPRKKNDYDGHTTEEKYASIRRFVGLIF